MTREPSNYQQLAGLVLLVRHGQTDYNAERRFQGHLDVPLNDKGRVQARQAGLFLSGLCRPDGRSLKPGSIESSDLRRAAETASIIHGVFEEHWPGSITSAPGVSPDFREFHVGHFEGRTFAELEEQDPEGVAHYMRAFEHDPEGTPYPGGESATRVRTRMKKAFRPLHRPVLPAELHPSRTSWPVMDIWRRLPFDIIVSHGGALSVMLTALGISLDRKLGNCDCLMIGRFDDGYQKIHHAEMT